MNKMNKYLKALSVIGRRLDRDCTEEESNAYTVLGELVYIDPVNLTLPYSFGELTNAIDLLEFWAIKGNEKNIPKDTPQWDEWEAVSKDIQESSLMLERLIKWVMINGEKRNNSKTNRIITLPYKSKEGH